MLQQSCHNLMGTLWEVENFPLKCTTKHQAEDKKATPLTCVACARIETATSLQEWKVFRTWFSITGLIPWPHAYSNKAAFLLNVLFRVGVFSLFTFAVYMEAIAYVYGEHVGEDVVANPHPKLGKSSKKGVTVEGMQTVQQNSTLFHVTMTLITICQVLLSWSIAQTVFSKQLIEKLVASTLFNSRRKDRTLKDVMHALYTSVAMSILIGILGFIPDFSSSFAYKEFADGEQWKVYVWQLGSVFLHIADTTGLCVFSALVLIHRARVVSCFRTVGTVHTDIEHIIARLLDIDLNLTYFSHKMGSRAMAIVALSFTRFLFGGWDHVTSTEGRFVTEPLTVPLILFLVVRPLVICTYLLICIGLLNKDCDFLRQVCSRYIVQERDLYADEKSSIENIHFEENSSLGSLGGDGTGAGSDRGSNHASNKMREDEKDSSPDESDEHYHACHGKGVEVHDKKARKKKEAAYKIFAQYYQSAAFQFNTPGGKIGLDTVWKFLVGSMSIYILLLRLKRWKLI